MDMTKMPGIAVCIWDFDGTLYRQQPALWDDIRAGEIRVIMEHTGWPEEKAKVEFYKIYKVVTPSGTQTVSIVTHISNEQSSIETAQYTDYTKYLRPDPRLIDLFRSLSHYQHFLLVNGTQAAVAKGLKLLGLEQSLFSEVVTSEVVGETKPSPKGFQHILQKTGLPKAAHLMIGDRELVDLVPAKALGMHTCLVWSDKESAIADVTVPTVYDLENVLR